MPFVTIPLPVWSRARSRTLPMPRLKPVNFKGDMEGFGVPVDDPDPFGVLALERAGLEIKEAGTRIRPASDAFEYRPSPTSPVFSTYARHSMQSIDGFSLRDHRRDSRRDSRRSMMSDQGTQTANFPSPVEEYARPFSPSVQSWVINEDGEDRLEKEPEAMVTKKSVPMIEEGVQTNAEAQKPTQTALAEQPIEVKHDPLVDDDNEDHTDDEAEAIIEQGETIQVFTRAKAVKPMASKVKLVTIPRRLPPPIPSRSSLRSRAAISINSDIANAAHDNADDSSSQYSPSPTRSGFDKNSLDSPNPWSRQTSIHDPESNSNERDIKPENIPIPDDDSLHNVTNAQEEQNKFPIAESMINPEVEEFLDSQQNSPSLEENTEAWSTLDRPDLLRLNTEIKDQIDYDIFHSIPTTPMEHAMGNDAGPAIIEEVL